MLRHLPSIPTHPLLVVCLLGNSLLRFTPMIHFITLTASESLQCITQLIASYYSVSLIVCATSSAKKRKVDIERRAFNPAWRENYFFMERFGQPNWCLICFKTVAVLKEFNMRRHWEAEHDRASNLGSMSPGERKTPSIDWQATCRKQRRSSASKRLRPTR